MRVEVIHAHELSEPLLRRWRELCKQNPDLRSPYFCPEYVRCVADVRPDVRVAVCREGDKVLAFFPFQRAWPRKARPVGGPMSDFQGLIATTETSLDPMALMRGARLKMIELDHQLVSQPALSEPLTSIEPSPFVDLSDGYEAYLRAAPGRVRKLEKYWRLGRKLERETGALRFELHTQEPRVALENLYAWKSAQYVQTGAEDLFAYAWARATIERLEAIRKPEFAGVLSALWAGESLVAVHMGMRSERVLHYWFPAYNRAYDKYSCGMVLLLHILRAAPEMGIDHVDLGKGMDPYKQRVMTGSLAVAEGRIALPSMGAAVTHGWERTIGTARKLPIPRSLRRVPGAVLRKMQRWAAYR